MLAIDGNGGGAAALTPRRTWSKGESSSVVEEEPGDVKLLEDLEEVVGEGWKGNGSAGYRF